MSQPTSENAETYSLHQRLAMLASQRAGFWLVLAVIIVIVLGGHQLLGVMDRDEARFAQASKQMVMSGDLITPYFMDEIRAKKPVAIYWLQSASAFIFGTDDIASYRLPSLAGLLASLFFIYHFAASLFHAQGSSRQTVRLQGFIAVCLFLSSPIILVEAHLAKTDSVLLAVIIFQQFMLWRVYRDRNLPLKERHSHKSWFGFWTGLGLSVLLKGPVGPAVALATLIGLVAVDRQWRWLGQLRWVSGLVWAAILVLPWAVAVSVATEGAFLNIAVQGDFIAKVQSGQESHGAPPGTYLLLSGLLLWPGICFAGFIFWLGRRVLEQDNLRFCMVWAGVYWLVVELIPTKLPHYILPSLPPLVLMISYALLKSLPAAGRWQKRLTDLFYLIGGLCAVLLVGVFVWASVQHSGVTGGRTLIFCMGAAVLAALFLKALLEWRKHRRFGHLLLVMGLGLGFNSLAISGITAGLDNIHLSARLAQQIEGLRPPPAAIVLAGYHEPSAVFHLGKDVLLVDGTEAGLFMAEAQDGLAVIEHRQLEAFYQTAREQGVVLSEIKQITGFNISKGQAVTLSLFRPAIAP